MNAKTRKNTSFSKMNQLTHAQSLSVSNEELDSWEVRYQLK